MRKCPEELFSFRFRDRYFMWQAIDDPEFLAEANGLVGRGIQGFPEGCVDMHRPGGKFHRQVNSFIDCPVNKPYGVRVTIVIGQRE